jgi:hypothetical protein
MRKDVNKKIGKKVKSAASGKCSHHLLLSWGNFHHRRKVQYIGGLIYGYCLYCCKLSLFGAIFPYLTGSNPIILISISKTFEEDA